MINNINRFIQYLWPFITYLLLAAVVYISVGYVYQYLILAITMLLLPLLDPRWRVPFTAGSNNDQALLWIVIALLLAILVIAISGQLTSLVFMLVFVAFPEEWFFRAYLMVRIGHGVKANIIVSCGFSILHMFTIGWQPALLVFFPSLVFGWIYQKQRNVFVVTTVHALSNLIYSTYLYPLC